MAQTKNSYSIVVILLLLYLLFTEQFCKAQLNGNNDFKHQWLCVKTEDLLNKNLIPGHDKKLFYNGVSFFVKK
jgi:hypothetical protein